MPAPTAYTAADLTAVKKRVISILNANPGVWSASVSTDVGAFPDDAEILAAILEADSIICTEGYFQSVNDAMANQFAVTTAPLADQDSIPFHKGTINKVEVSKSSQTFVRTSGNVFTAAAHGLTTGQLVSLVTTGVSADLPDPLATFTNYWVIYLSANTFSLASSLSNALAASPIPITDAGTGTSTIIAWQIGVEARNIDDVTNATAVGETYVNTTGAFDFLYKEDSGVIYTPATYARVTYPEYVSNGATPRCNQNETTLLVATAVRILVKNASPAPFEAWINESVRGLQQLVEDGAYTAQHSEVANP